MSNNAFSYKIFFQNYFSNHGSFNVAQLRISQPSLSYWTMHLKEDSPILFFLSVLVGLKLSLSFYSIMIQFNFFSTLISKKCDRSDFFSFVQVEFFKYSEDDFDLTNNNYEVTSGNATLYTEVHVFDLEPAMNYKFHVKVRSTNSLSVISFESATKEELKNGDLQFL